MRRNYHEFCEYPVQNASGETIPAFACLQVSGYQSFIVNGEPVIGFSVKKPDGKGKLYLINSPYDIPAGGQGDASDSPGSFVLFEGSLPSAAEDGSLVEWGPKKDSWAISKDGKGFVIVGQEEGAPASEPGFPPVASTKRVRVAMVTAAEQENKIQGTVASTATENSQQFLIDNIVVLSGTDPREDPNNPLEAVLIQNSPRKARQIDVDVVTAIQAKSDNLWYPIEAEAVAADSIFIARVTGPSSGIGPAVVGSSATSPTLRMFKGYGVRYTVKDIPDPGFGNANDMAEPETEDSLSVTWIGEANDGADLYPDTEERIRNSVSSPTTIELINWVRVRINVGDRVVVARVTTQRGRLRHLIIARDCAE